MSHHKPLLSVIVPVYNVAPWLRECIDSILCQTFTDFELLLVDDGSSDESGIICDEYAATDSRVRVWHQANAGQAAARNLALDNARGRYYAFIDSDDYLSSDTFNEALKAFYKTKNIGFVQFPIAKNNELLGHTQSAEITGPDNIYRVWLDKKNVTNYFCDKIWDARVFDNLRFPEGWVFEDRYLMADSLLRCKSAVLTDKGMYHYRVREGQTTGRKRTAQFLKSMLHADSHILDLIPSDMKQARAMVLNRAFSTYIEFAQSFDDREVDEWLCRHVARTSIINRAYPVRMKLFKVLGPKLYRKFLA